MCLPCASAALCEKIFLGTALFQCGPLDFLNARNQNITPVSSIARNWFLALKSDPRASPGVILARVMKEASGRTKNILYCHVGVIVNDQALLPGP
jgi:hypothetical protein